MASKFSRAAMLGALLAALGMIALPAAAKQSDRSKPVNVDAGYADATAQANGVSHLKGGVTVTQGTLKAQATTGTIYFDAHSQVKRVLLQGSPATVQQEDDAGNMMHGRADTIDYDVTGGIATLTGNAHVDQQDRGSASGAKLVYNTSTSSMTAQGDQQQRVHLTFTPRQTASSTTTPAPASTSTTATRQLPAPASSQGQP